ncbi:MAG: amidase family protein, partial [Gammaproteobacteria bacterium]
MIDHANIPAEATIAELHAAMRGGRLSAVELVTRCLAQIERCDQQGPALNAVVTVNPAAAARAAELDRAHAENGSLQGALHGIPIVIKDCLETTTLPTSFGSEVFADYMATEDATVVRRLHDAGAIILAKTTLPDWATSWFAYSSRSGETRNPYALDRDPGGSSSGTGAAVAAGYAPIGLGTDCGGSIRLPASFCGLVGVRSTPGLISRHGCNPLVGLQDTIGPMGRTVEDTARVFGVLAGYDERDPLTCTHTIARAPSDYLAGLRPDALLGRRVGVVRNAFGSDEIAESRAVNTVVNGAIDAMQAGGATVVDVTIPDLGDWLMRTSLYIAKSKHDIDRFL